MATVYMVISAVLGGVFGYILSCLRNRRTPTSCAFGCRDVECYRHGKQYRVQCQECGTAGPPAETRAEAWRRWEDV